MKFSRLILVNSLVVLALIGASVWLVTSSQPNRRSSMQIDSPKFADGQPIPARFTCQGQDISPPLRISKVPAKAISLALIMDDPDAPGGTFDHWIMWNLPTGLSDLAQNQVPAGAVQGVNGFAKNGYGGPCPPSGTHHYHFKLYALDRKLELPSSAGKAALEAAMKGHILEQTELVGTFSK